MKRQPQNDLIVLVLSKRGLLVLIDTVIILATALISLWGLGAYLKNRVDISPFAVLAFTDNGERIGTMTGGVINNSPDTGLAGDAYSFHDANSGGAVSIWHLTTGKHDYMVRFEDEDQSAQNITLEHDPDSRGKFEVQSTYYSDETGYNYAGEGKLMFIGFNIPRPYSWHGQGFSLRSYYQIEWDVHGAALWRHVVYCVLLLCTILMSVAWIYRIFFRKSKAAFV